MAIRRRIHRPTASIGAIGRNISYFLDPANHIFAIDDDAGWLDRLLLVRPGWRVPGGDYDADALDIGIGIRPNLTGQGYGTG